MPLEPMVKPYLDAILLLVRSASQNDAISVDAFVALLRAIHEEMTLDLSNFVEEDDEF